MNDQIKARLLQRWCSVWARILGWRGLTQNVQEFLYEEFERVLRSYAEEHRRFHDIEHIDRLLELLDRFWYLADDFEAVSLAVWYHDIVYDTCKVRRFPETNEELSRQRVRWVMERLGLPEAFQLRVDGCVLATLHTPETARTNDEKLIADLDWGSLGTPWERFHADGERIGEEYIGEGRYTREEFLAGRLAFLKGALMRKDRPNVVRQQYHHPDIQKVFEQQAIENLARSISELEAVA